MIRENIDTELGFQCITSMTSQAVRISNCFFKEVWVVLIDIMNSRLLKNKKASVSIHDMGLLFM